MKAGVFGVRIVISRSVFRFGPSLSPLEKGIIEGDNPVHGLERPKLCDTLSKSRVVWECSSKWVVNAI